MSDTNKTTDASDAADTLDFETSGGSGVSGWVATALTLALIAWMGSGYIFPAEEAAAPEARDAGRRAATRRKSRSFSWPKGRLCPIGRR